MVPQSRPFSRTRNRTLRPTRLGGMPEPRPQPTAHAKHSGFENEGSRTQQLALGSSQGRGNQATSNVNKFNGKFPTAATKAAAPFNRGMAVLW
jgi:hypothetical protein